MKKAKIVYEYCPHCTLEAKLKNEFKPQRCNECGNIILPCTICEDARIDAGDIQTRCGNCPLIEKKANMLQDENIKMRGVLAEVSERINNLLMCDEMPVSSEAGDFLVEIDEKVIGDLIDYKEVKQWR